MDKGRTTRIIAIGVDSADFHLLEKWVNEGRLPAITSLISRGCWIKLNSTADVGSGTTWPSLFTGSSPAKHNGMGSRRMKSGGYNINFSSHETNITLEPFWIQLSRSGKRVAIIDVPRTSPSKDLNGLHLVGWGAHSPAWHFDSWPQGLHNKIVSRYGSYPAPDCDEFIPTGYKELKRFYENMLEGIGKKQSLSDHLLHQEPWDFFLTVFAEPHCVGHNYWHLMDKEHPKYDPKMAETLGDAIQNVYSLVDSAIGKLLSSGRNVTLLVFSQEGMGPNYTGTHLLPDILKRLGMEDLSLRNRSKTGDLGPSNLLLKMIRKWVPWAGSGPHAIRNLKSQLPGEMVKLLEVGKQIVPLETWHRWKCRFMSMGNDWSRIRAFCFPSDFNGAIRINLKGRESGGCVEAGNEYQALCQELVHELGQLKNADTGKSAVSEVIRVDDIHKGPHRNELADIIVKWRGDRPIRGLSSPRIGTVRGENNHERTGSHRPHGFLLAAGEHIVSGISIENGTIMDIAPTILYLLGETIPPGMDGRVLLEIIDDRFKKSNSVGVGKTGNGRL